MNAFNNVFDFPAQADQRLVQLPSPLPAIFRLISVNSYQVKATCWLYSATLFHRDCSIRVKWSEYKPNHRVRAGGLVKPRGFDPAVNHGDWAYKITALSAPRQADPDLNLFRTVPSGWVNDGELLDRGAGLFDAMPKPYRHLFNAIFWDSERFRRYCTNPSSMNNHHNVINGNLLHSIETAQWLQRDCAEQKLPVMDSGLCILLGLLHDAGKADEYEPTSRGGWTLSDRGKLLGHKVTITEWIAVAKTTYGLALPEASYLALLHCLNSSQNAPQWLGIREASMLEAILLSGYDRQSGKIDLYRQLMPQTSTGWGQYHTHMKNRPYYIAAKGALSTDEL